MATKGSQNIDGYYEEDDDNDGDQRKNKNRMYDPESPDKKLVIDLSACDAPIKQEGMDSNTIGHVNMMFGSEGGGFLDILASVAASKLEEEQSDEVNQKPCNQSHETEIEQGFAATAKTFRTQAHLGNLEHICHSNNSKRPREVEGGYTSSLSKRANPRRLADYEKFGFAQISRMSLNTLLRLFSEPDFDEMRRIYSYKCYFMPDGVCQEKVQSFGNEAKAKAQMKNHLQSHIKDTLKRDDYYQFTAEPVAARKKRLAQQQKGTNNNASKDIVFPTPSPVELAIKNSDFTGSKVIKREFSNVAFTNTNNPQSFDENVGNVILSKHEPRDAMTISSYNNKEQMCHKTNNPNSPAIEIMQDTRITKMEPIFVTEYGKENVPTTITDNKNGTNNALCTVPIIYDNQSDKEQLNSQQKLISNLTISDYPEATSKAIQREVPEGNAVGQGKLVTSQNNKLNTFTLYNEKFFEDNVASSFGPIVVVESSLEKKSAGVKLEKPYPGNEEIIIHADDFTRQKLLNEVDSKITPTENINLKEDALAKQKGIRTLKDIQASVLEDHCYAFVHKNDTYYLDAPNTQTKENDFIPQRPMEMEQTIRGDQQSNDPLFYGCPSNESSTKLENDKTQAFYFTSHSNEVPQTSWSYIPPIASEVNITNPSTSGNIIKIISENQILSYGGNSSENTSLRKPDLSKTSNSVPISPITTTRIPTRTRTKTRPASTTGFSVKAEVKPMSEQAEKEKCDALQAIRQLQAKGATTEDLSCHICQPSKCFTAYTTLLSHLRSHAGIRKFKQFKKAKNFLYFYFLSRCKYLFSNGLYFLVSGPYECHVCRAVFTRQHSLNYHLLIHQNETRFTCNDCGRKFRYVHNNNIYGGA